MDRPVIALITDFGTSDPYVGAMKGAMLSVCREATLVDITHDVPPHDCLTGALYLASAVPFFPPATTFLAVVDPGVGTARRAIAAEAAGFRFVGPDNGLLSLALAAHGPARVVSLDQARFARPAVSRTFEGRDRFGPAAAWLALGTPLAEFGSPVDRYCEIELPRPRVGPEGVSGVVLAVDRFGNLITSLHRNDVEAGLASGAAVAHLKGREVGPVVGTYADVPVGAPCALVGSAGYLELAVRERNAAHVLGGARGDAVLVVWR